MSTGSRDCQKFHWRQSHRREFEALLNVSIASKTFIESLPPGIDENPPSEEPVDEEKSRALEVALAALEAAKASPPA